MGEPVTLKLYEVIGRLEADTADTFRVLAKADGEGRQVPLWGKIGAFPNQEAIKGGTIWQFGVKNGEEIVVAESLTGSAAESETATTANSSTTSPSRQTVPTM